MKPSVPSMKMFFSISFPLSEPLDRAEDIRSITGLQLPLILCLQRTPADMQKWADKISKRPQLFHIIPDRISRFRKGSEKLQEEKCIFPLLIDNKNKSYLKDTDCQKTHFDQIPERIILFFF